MAVTDVLIAAAGTGDRFGEQPKQFTLLRDRPMIVWAIEPFSKHSGIDRITVVVNGSAAERFRRVIDEYGLDKVVNLVPGGETRQDSVRRGLDALQSDSDTVLVHDAARPCLSAGLLQRILDTLRRRDAVIPSVPVVDTLIREASGTVADIVERDGVSGVQTPQGFRTELLRRAHEHARTNDIQSSDDGSLVAAMGGVVATVSGETTNIKVTFESDIVIAEAILAQHR